ncbi:hypothetical protein PVAG01_09788 [Phlyctema vagabunda]|uniref:Uncharacterized protein n=1 Tax=Phlyctema vagabunda TaxID=108571 RepID=A0ABR4P455_9HELO
MNRTKPPRPKLQTFAQFQAKKVGELPIAPLVEKSDKLEEDLRLLWEATVAKHGERAAATLVLDKTHWDHEFKKIVHREKMQGMGIGLGYPYAAARSAMKNDIREALKSESQTMMTSHSDTESAMEVEDDIKPQRSLENHKLPAHVSKAIIEIATEAAIDVATKIVKDATSGNVSQATGKENAGAQATTQATTLVAQTVAARVAAQVAADVAIKILHVSKPGN